MGFYFCDRYKNIDANDKKVERDMYAAISYFWGSNDQEGMKIGKTISKIFSAIFS